MLIDDPTQQGVGGDQTLNQPPAQPPPVPAAPQQQNPPQPTPPTPQVPAQQLAAVEAARQAEQLRAQQLAADNQRLTQELAQSRQALTQRMSPEEQTAARLAQVEQTNAQLQSQLTEQRLQAYLNKRLLELQKQGVEFVEARVGGRSEQEIEASISAAIQEFSQWQEFFLQRFLAEQQAAQPPAPAAPYVSASGGPPPQAPPVGQVRQVAGPQDFPRPVNAQPIPGADVGTAEFTQQVAALTTPDAVRSGEYARNRAQLHSTLRQQGAGHGVLSNQPRHIGPVYQPQGHPTGPVQDPRLAHAGRPQPQQPQAPQPVAAPQPVQYQQPQHAAPQPVMAQPQQVQQFVQQPVVHPQGFSPEQMQAARERAIGAARQHLQNPGSAPMNGRLRGPAALPPPNPQGAMFDGTTGGRFTNTPPVAASQQ